MKRKTQYERDFDRSQRYLSRNQKAWTRAKRVGWIQFESMQDEVAAAYIEGMRAARRTSDRGGKHD